MYGRYGISQWMMVGKVQQIILANAKIVSNLMTKPYWHPQAMHSHPYFVPPYLLDNEMTMKRLDAGREAAL